MGSESQGEMASSPPVDTGIRKKLGFQGFVVRSMKKGSLFSALFNKKIAKKKRFQTGQCMQGWETGPKRTLCETEGRGQLARKEIFLGT